MPAERALNPHDVKDILSWGRRWRAIETLKEIATKHGVSEATVRRLVNNGGYVPPKKPVDIEDLARRIDSFSSVPRETDENLPLGGPQ